MRGQAFLQNAVLVCVTMHTFRIVLNKCCFRLLTTWLACLPHFIIVWNTLAVALVKIKLIFLVSVNIQFL